MTYIPRLFPFVVVYREKMPARLSKFLQFIPCAALGALIIPGVFSSIPEMPQAAIFGIGFAFIYAWYKGGIIVPVLGSILVAYGVLLVN